MQILNSRNQFIHQTDFRYDLVGNLISQTEHVYVEGEVRRQATTSWSYDALNRKIEQKEATGTNEEKTTRYAYNRNGLQTHLFKPNGVIIEYTFDRLGRCIEERSSDGTIHYKTLYDKNDNPLINEDMSGYKTTRLYNRHNDLIEEVLSNKATLRYTYDRLGRVQSIFYPDESSVSYTYHGSFLKKVSRISKGSEIYHHLYSNYDLSGLLLEAQLPGACGLASYSYDLCERPIKDQNLYRNETSHTYDSVGNLLKRTIEDPLGKVECSYAYDDLSQLILETGIATHRYLNDSVFNHVEKDGEASEHNSLHQLLQRGENPYRYDLNGNLIEKGSTYYRYDARDRLIHLKNDNNEFNFTYDAFNRRIKTTSDKDEQFYFYDLEQEIGAVNSTGSLTELKVMGSHPIVIEINGIAYVPLHDTTGSIIALVLLENGQFVEGYRHSAYCEEICYDASQAPLVKPLNPWRYASKRVDESGLLYFGERFYEPTLSRWLNPDPLGFADGPNLYAYVRNNPFIFSDPTGLFCIAMMSTPFDTRSMTFEQFQPKQDVDLFKTFKNSYEDVRFGGVGLLDYRYTGGYLNAQLSYADPISGFLNQIDSFTPHPTTSEQLQQRYSDRAIGVLNRSSSGMCIGEMPSPGGLIQKSKGVAKKVLKQVEQLPEGHIWFKTNPFKNKTAQELHDAFKKKGYLPTGDDPLNGLGSYLNPKNKRQYRIDPYHVGQYREPNHVDVERLKNYRGPLGKKRFSYADE